MTDINRAIKKNREFWPDKMTDAGKLESLAEWLDWKYPNDPEPEVQHDLRAIAQDIRKKDAEIAALKEWVIRLQDEIQRQREELRLADQTTKVWTDSYDNLGKRFAALKKVIKAQERLLLSYRVGGRPPEWVFDVLAKAKDDGLI
jgi:septal ring factor EnvC (AmiA/AmiB activator)